MIYISHLLPDEEMREVIEKTGAGVESIEFSIAENLDRLEDSISSYKKRIRNMGAENLILHGPFLDLNPMTFDREIGRVTRFRYEQAYRAAEELGAEKIVYHSCLCPDAYLLTGWAERTAEFYREFLRGKQGPEVAWKMFLTGPGSLLWRQSEKPAWRIFICVLTRDMPDVIPACRQKSGRCGFRERLPMSMCMTTGEMGTAIWLWEKERLTGEKSAGSSGAERRLRIPLSVAARRPWRSPWKNCQLSWKTREKTGENLQNYACIFWKGMLYY